MVHEQLILKFLYPHLAADQRMLARFIHELRYARRVSHENVIRIHDFLKIDQAYAISMEYFPSQNLSDELQHQAPLALPRGLWIAFHVCSGMQAAHHAQIIHRDLKPPNILINDAGLVKIVDFGLAAVSNDTASRLTKTGALLGTPLYMAPEQVQNHTLDARVDIYSLGIIMYEIFTGTPPYTGENPMAVLFQHVAGKATPPRDLNPAIPKPLEAIILQAMAAETDKRFQTMDALGKQLAPLLKQYLR
jgi:serine/threonine protein kinase